jgi:hypothetical protein
MEPIRLLDELIPPKKEKPKVEQEEYTEVKDVPWWTVVICPYHGTYDYIDGSFCGCEGAMTRCVAWLRGTRLYRTRLPRNRLPRPHPPNGAGKG